MSKELMMKVFMAGLGFRVIKAIINVIGFIACYAIFAAIIYLCLQNEIATKILLVYVAFEVAFSTYRRIRNLCFDASRRFNFCLESSEIVIFGAWFVVRLIVDLILCVKLPLIVFAFSESATLGIYAMMFFIALESFYRLQICK